MAHETSPRAVHYGRNVGPCSHRVKTDGPLRPLCLALGASLELFCPAEIGIGTGLNIPFYTADNVTHLYGLEPAEALSKKARHVATQVDFPVTFLDLPGESIPLEENAVDTVVITYTLCTIADPLRALHEIKRVLKPDGTLLFCEHGIAPEPGVSRLQGTLNPIWKGCAGGCNLNRDIPTLIQKAGFSLVELQTMYLPGIPKFAGYNYWGAAKSGVPTTS